MHKYKYDGERAQIHYYKDNGPVEIFSRQKKCQTVKFPDVVAGVARFKKSHVRSFILDCELVGYDRQKKKILSFQTLSRRSDKDVNVNDIKVEVCIFGFDLLYLNGQPLLQEPLKVRKQRLYDSFEEEPGFFQFVPAMTSNKIEEIQTFFDAAVVASCEGLVTKTLERDAAYEPSKRSLNWLKLKKDYMRDIGDSLDLVPIAAFHGHGKRTGVYGSFLLVCYDSNNDEFRSICKIGTGFSEQELEQCSTNLRSIVIPKPQQNYRFGDKLTPTPDVWFRPSQVWEIRYYELTISSTHSEKGISLRNPRLVRFQHDKSPEQATSSEQIAEMYADKQCNGSYNVPVDDEDVPDEEGED